MLLITTVLASDSIWRRLVSDWHDDLGYWLRHGLPRVLVILIVAFILSRVLRLFTEKLQEYSNRDALPSGIRAQQLRTLAAVIQSVGVVVIFFFALLQILPIFSVDVKPFLASAGV